MGYPIFCAVRLGTLSELVPSIRSYREAYRGAGHPGEGQVFLRVPVYVAEDAQRAWEEPEQSIMYFYRMLGAQLADSATREGARAVEQRAERGQRLQMIDYEEVLREKIVAGTPDAVVRRLREIREELGLDGILAELNCGSRIPLTKVLRSLELLCREVIGAFRPAAI